jgi:hypothetical protein
MTITYPLMTVLDDSGAIVSGATVTVATVLDKAGTAIASPGETLNQSGPNVSVDYDSATHGEAWITLAISKEGSTITGLNAAPSFYLSNDSSTLASGGGLFVAGTVSTVTSASSIVVAFTGSAPTAAGLVGLFCCLASTANSPAKQEITSASAVDSTHLLLGFTAPFEVLPVIGNLVQIG